MLKIDTVSFHGGTCRLTLDFEKPQDAHDLAILLDSSHDDLRKQLEIIDGQMSVPVSV